MSEQGRIGWKIELERQRIGVLNVLLGTAVIGGTIAVIPPLFRVLQDPQALSHEWPFLMVYVVVLLTFLFRRVDYRIRAAIPIVGAYLMGISLLWANGVASHGPWYLLMVSSLLFTLSGRRAGLISLVVSGLIYAGFGLGHYQGWIELSQLLDPRDLEQLQNVGSNFVLVLILIGIAQTLFDRAREQAIHDAYERGDELARAQQRLQEHAEELARTNLQLQKRAWQLEVAADVLGSTSGIMNLDILLNRVAELIYARFRSLGVECVGIFMVEVRPVLRAVAESTDTPSPPLKAAGIPETVSQTLRTGSASLRGDEQEAANLELVLPLIPHPSPQGALYIRSTQRDAFQTEDLATLQTLADQLSIAIQNVSLLQQTQEQLREVRLLSQQYTQDTWREASEAGTTFRYAQAQERDVRKVEAPLAAPQVVKDALRAGHTIADCHESPDNAGQEVISMALPIKMRDIVIGVVNIQRSAEARANWSQEQITLAETVVEQLGLALESAQLYQSTQRRAAYERLVSEITARLRESLDVDTILQTAAREMGETLELHDVTIQLEMGTEQVALGDSI